LIDGDERVELAIQKRPYWNPRASEDASPAEDLGIAMHDVRRAGSHLVHDQSTAKRDSANGARFTRPGKRR
jgi:hypothetical protein